MSETSPEELLEKQSIAEAEVQLQECLAPEMVPDWDKFECGGRKFKIEPMKFRWEKEFRRRAMPIISAGLQPVEMLLTAAAGGQTTFKSNIGITDAISRGEVEVDLYLSGALAVVCASQDLENKDKRPSNEMFEPWALKIEDELTRDEIVGLVEKQLEVIKAMDSLGNSFSRRLKSLSNLLGKDLKLGSLLPSTITPAGATSEKVGTSGLTVSRSSGTSTGEPSPST